MLTEQQLEFRKNHVTATESSIVLGVNRYESVYDLWKVKTGLEQPRNLDNNPKVIAGRFLESAIADIFTHHTGKELINLNDSFEHPEHKWMSATPDRIIVGENAGLEIKTASYDARWGEQGVNIIPDEYLCQVTQQISVMSWDYCYVAVLISGWDFRYYIIDRNKKLEQIIIDKTKHFWYENVLKDIPPEPRNLDDVVDMYRYNSTDESIRAHKGIYQTFLELKACKEKLKEYAEKEKELKTEIALFMKNHERLVDPENNLLATFKYNKDSLTFDKELFEKEHKELYDSYCRQTAGQRQMRLK